MALVRHEHSVGAFKNFNVLYERLRRDCVLRPACSAENFPNLLLRLSYHDCPSPRETFYMMVGKNTIAFRFVFQTAQQFVDSGRCGDRENHIFVLTDSRGIPNVIRYLKCPSDFPDIPGLQISQHCVA